MKITSNTKINQHMIPISLKLCLLKPVYIYSVAYLLNILRRSHVNYSIKDQNLYISHFWYCQYVMKMISVLQSIVVFIIYPVYMIYSVNWFLGITLWALLWITHKLVCITHVHVPNEDNSFIFATFAKLHCLCLICFRFFEVQIKF